MRITGWSIDGFGVFKDYRVSDLSPGLSVFLGPNEAGKSTLLAFLQGVLFGFPDGRSADSKYPPLRGGSHGGRLFICTAEGDLVVEREAARRNSSRITRSDGSAVEETYLYHLLGDVDRKLFCSIFSFDLKALESFKRMSEDGIRERIFAAGIVGAGRSARQVGAKLSAEAEALYKPRGNKQVLAELRKERDELKLRLKEASTELHRYQDLRAEEERLGRHVEGITARLDRMAEEERKLQTLLDLWPVWYDLDRAKARLAELPHVVAFPTDGFERLARVQTHIKNSKAKIDEVGKQLNDAENDIVRGQERIDRRLSAVAEKVFELHDLRLLQREHLLDRNNSQAELERNERDLAALIAGLGPGWDEERIASFDASLPRRETVRTWKRNHDALLQRIDEIDHNISSKQEALEEKGRERAALKKALDENPVPREDDLLAAEEALVRCRTWLLRYSAIEERIRSRQQVVDDRKGTLKDAEHDSSAGPPGWSVWIASTLAVASVIAAGAALVSENAALGLALAIVALFFSLLSGWSWSASRRRAQYRERVRELQESLKPLEADIRDQEGEASTLRTSLGEAARTLDLPEKPDPEEIARKEHEVAESRRSFIAAQSQKDRLKGIEEGVSHLKKSLAVVEQDGADLRRQRDELLHAWEAWKREVNLPDHLLLDGALDYLNEIQAAQACLAGRNRVRESVQSLQNEITRWEIEARQVAIEVGCEKARVKAGEDLIDVVIELQKKCLRQQEVTALVGASEKLAEDLRRNMRLTESRLAGVEKELAELLEESGARDEEDFRRRGEIKAERTHLEHEIESGVSQMERRLGRGAFRVEILAELAKGVVDVWEDRINVLRGQSGQLREEQSEANRALGRATSERENLEASADIPSIETALQAVEAEMRTALREWLTASVAKRLIDDTLEDFMKTRQPAVLQWASDHFRSVTDSYYEQVLLTDGVDDLGIVDRYGRLKRSTDLSRGTAEQLYLCLRFGLANEYARKRVALPFIMDDVLVNFDPNRATRMASIIVEVAQRHQVLLFTCHPSTVECFQEIDPTVDVKELPRHGVETVTGRPGIGDGPTVRELAEVARPR